MDYMNYSFITSTGEFVMIGNEVLEINDEGGGWWVVGGGLLINGGEETNVPLHRDHDISFTAVHYTLHPHQKPRWNG